MTNGNNANSTTADVKVIEVTPGTELKRTKENGVPYITASVVIEIEGKRFGGNVNLYHRSGASQVKKSSNLMDELKNL